MFPVACAFRSSFLGYVDLQGTTYSSTTLATGYGSMIAQPLLRKYVEGREGVLTEAESRQIMEDCMKVLFYRDARSLNKVRLLRLLELYWLTVISTKSRRSRQMASRSPSRSVHRLSGRLRRRSGDMVHRHSRSGSTCESNELLVLGL